MTVGSERMIPYAVLPDDVRCSLRIGDLIASQARHDPELKVVAGEKINGMFGGVVGDVEGLLPLTPLNVMRQINAYGGRQTVRRVIGRTIQSLNNGQGLINGDREPILKELKRLTKQRVLDSLLDDRPKPPEFPHLPRVRKP